MEQFQYATVKRRWVASFLDGLVIAGANILITLLLSQWPSAVQITGLMMSFGYYVYSIARFGQTLGKKWLGIKVQTMDGQVPGYKKALIRETVGKLVSGLALGIGYLWAIWDKDKQTWHDKMAKTVVVGV